MTPEPERNLRLEIGHVLFIDLVGYSKLLIEEQKERMRQLTDIVLATAQVREVDQRATRQAADRRRDGAGLSQQLGGTGAMRARNCRKRSRRIRRLRCGWEFTAGR